MGAVGQRKASGEEPLEFFLPDLCTPRSVFLMILLGELLVVVHVLAATSLPRFDWNLLAAGSLTVQWIVLLSAAILCRLRVPLSHMKLQLAVAACLLIVALVTLGSSFFFVMLPSPYLEQSSSGWQILRNVLVAVVVAGIALRYFYLQEQLRLQEQLELQARLNSLRDRIRPHFLFNTLNSIASLIMSRPEAAERAVEDLSELFRNSLRDERGNTTVADELRLCELYLGIEKLRLGDRLAVDWQIDAQARQHPMPSLLLQPLVENAVYHGVSRMPAGGTVRVSVQLTGSEVVASVENPVPAQPAPSSGHNIALTNIGDRLDALYRGAGKLRLVPGEGVFRVELSYPREGAA